VSVCFLAGEASLQKVTCRIVQAARKRGTQSELQSGYIMEDYSLEPQPFYISDDNSVRLFKGFSTARNGAPIVAKRHEFLLLRDKDKFSQRLMKHSM